MYIGCAQTEAELRQQQQQKQQQHQHQQYTQHTPPNISENAKVFGYLCDRDMDIGVEKLHTI